ncbi:hypothetical protein [Saliterribacillus persicus]|uniref:Regulatory protein YrvL n=1 Tax=Saliterribacillus persicus TaxID=930114 RepID=A0A368X867_9BACI|nr:hypothetical protein [Saliterribacillus persicus]RCW63899.1 hypothetical protein DFR57_11524 [Saliterribacillus persicus]
MIFLEKIIVSVLSALILSLTFAFSEYTPVAEQQAGVGYFSFTGLLFIYFIYSCPVYLIGGSIYSYFADIYLNQIQFRNKLLKYVTEFIVYVVGGLLIIGIFLILLGGYNSASNIYMIFLFGAVASLLFFHSSLAWKKTMEFLAR